MAELRELFEMTTKQMEPDQDSWRKQEERHHRDARRKKLGALAVAATIAVVAAVGIVWNLDGDEGADGTTPATIGPRPTDLGSGTYLVDLRTGRSTPIEGSARPGIRRLTRWDQHRVRRAQDRRRRSRRHERARVRRDQRVFPERSGERPPLVTRWADDRVPGRRPEREDRQPLRPRRGLGEGDPADRSRTDQLAPLVHVAELQPRRWIDPVHESSGSVRIMYPFDRERRSAGLAPLVDPVVRRRADDRGARCRLRRVLAGRQHDRVHADLGEQRGRRAARRRSGTCGSRTRTGATAGSSSAGELVLPSLVAGRNEDRVSDDGRGGHYVVDVDTGETTRIADASGGPSGSTTTPCCCRSSD